jgi:hypothetical protein
MHCCQLRLFAVLLLPPPVCAEPTTLFEFYPKKCPESGFLLV